LFEVKLPYISYAYHSNLIANDSVGVTVGVTYKGNFLKYLWIKGLVASVNPSLPPPILQYNTHYFTKSIKN